MNSARVRLGARLDEALSQGDHGFRDFSTLLLALVTAAKDSPRETSLLRSRVERVGRRLNETHAGRTDLSQYAELLAAASIYLSRLRSQQTHTQIENDYYNRQATVRGAVLSCLREADQLRPRDIVERTGADPAQVSRALRQLLDAGEVFEVVSDDSDGRARFYRLAKRLDHTDELRILADLYCRDDIDMTTFVSLCEMSDKTAATAFRELSAENLIRISDNDNLSLTVAGKARLRILAAEGYTETFKDTLDRVSREFAGVVAILGPAGSGKQSIAADLAREYGWEWASMGKYLTSLRENAIGHFDSNLYDHSQQVIKNKGGYKHIWKDVLAWAHVEPGVDTVVVDAYYDVDVIAGLHAIYENVAPIVLEPPEWLRRLHFLDAFGAGVASAAVDEAMKTPQGVAPKRANVERVSVVGIPLRAA